MMNWEDISLFKFQKIDVINNDPKMPDIDKTLFCTAIAFDYTEFELDNLPLKKVEKLTHRLTNIINSEFPKEPKKRIGKFFIKYDISKMSFGQYIEISFFLSNNPLQNVHYIIASISNLPFLKNNSKHHRKKAEYFLKKPVTKFIGTLTLLIEKFSEFNKEYKDLFGLDREVNGDVQGDPFNKRYGWIYSASQLAEYERIKLEDAFRLPVRQAFNDLSFLKAKAKYESDQLKQK